MPGIVERAVLRGSVPIERVEVSAFTIPTDFPESDGTITWDSTTLVLVEAAAGGEHERGGFHRRHRGVRVDRHLGPRQGGVGQAARRRRMAGQRCCVAGHETDATCRA